MGGALWVLFTLLPYHCSIYQGRSQVQQWHVENMFKWEEEKRKALVEKRFQYDEMNRASIRQMEVCMCWCRSEGGRK